MKNNVLVGVTGGIAAYKAAEIVRNLKKQGLEVNVIMTENALNFISPATFRTLSENPVVTDTFNIPPAWNVGHISLAKKADVILIAPATANFIGKASSGIADDMLTTTVMASKAKVLIAPSMNVNMYENPIVQANIDYLKLMGYEFIEPGEGFLACGDTGKGRLADPQEIVERVVELLKLENCDEPADDESNAVDPINSEEGAGWTKAKLKDFIGAKILVSAGPTVENIDPVRYISNRSSGKMGFAIAEAALKRGAEVTLVAGPVNLKCSDSIKRIDVVSATEMETEVNKAFDDIDIVIMAAAPADYRMESIYEQKIKKDEERLNIALVKNNDILYGLGKKKGDKILVGFAAETQNLESYARSKMEKKNLDMIVANNVSLPGAGFDKDTNIITIIKSQDNSLKEYGQMSKSQAADVILDNIKSLDIDQD